MMIFGAILIFLSIILYISLFFLRIFFGGFFKKIESAFGFKDIGGGVFDFLAGGIYLNIFLFLSLPGIVFILIGYFY